MKIRLVLRLGILAVCLGSSGLCSQAAFGQAQNGDCSSDPPCKTLAERAKELSASGNLAEALRLYELAYSVRADAALLFNLARVLHKQGRAAEAASYYQKYIASPAADEEQKAKARAFQKQVQLAQPDAVSTPQSVATVPEETSDRQAGAAGSLTSTEGTGRDQAVPSKSVVKKWWFWVVTGGCLLAASAITAGAVHVDTGAAQPATARVPPANTAMFLF